MKRILVTGGDGYFGSSIVQTLLEKGQTVRVMSRNPQPDNLADNLEWAQADVLTGEGIEAALDGVHTVVNCMSSPLENTYEVDIVGTRNFLAQAKQQGIQYVLHISIIGIDRVMFPYYQYKLGAELVVAESGIPYLISRIAQFYYFVDYLLSPLNEAQSDELAVPLDVQFQAMSEKDAAVHLAPYIIEARETGRLQEIAGTQILTLAELVPHWLQAQNIDKTIKPANDTDNDLPFFNAFGDGFVNGYNTNPEIAVGSITWKDYLQQRYAQAVK